MSSEFAFEQNHEEFNKPVINMSVLLGEPQTTICFTAWVFCPFLMGI